MEGNKAPSGARKVKKKQVKEKLDRIKQAEKKRRRLENALATSAAIRSELEKKKKEEQQRLDGEGAAIAEAVALHVLGEDSDDMYGAMLKKDEILNPWDCASNFDLLMGGKKAGSAYHDMSKYSLEGIGWVSDAQRSGCMSNNWEDIDWTISSGAFGRNITMRCDEGDWEEHEISSGLLQHELFLLSRLQKMHGSIHGFSTKCYGANALS